MKADSSGPAALCHPSALRPAARFSHTMQYEASSVPRKNCNESYKTLKSHSCKLVLHAYPYSVHVFNLCSCHGTVDPRASSVFSDNLYHI